MALTGFPDNISLTLGSIWTGKNGLSPGSLVILRKVSGQYAWTEDGTLTPNDMTNRLRFLPGDVTPPYSYFNIDWAISNNGGFNVGWQFWGNSPSYDYPFLLGWNTNNGTSAWYPQYIGFFNTSWAQYKTIFTAMAEAATAPAISASPSPIKLWTKLDGTAPDPVSLEVSNPGLANLNAVVTSPTNSWISVSNGTVPELAPGNSNDDTTVQISHTETLTWGEENDGSVTITDVNASNNPVVHPVKYMAGMTKAVKSNNSGNCRGFGITAFPMANAVNSTGLTIQWLMKKDEFNPWQNAMESFFNVGGLTADGNTWAFRLWYRGVASNLYHLTYGNPQFWNGYHRTKLYQLGPTDHNVSPLQGYLGTGWHLFTARIRNEANTSDDLDLFVDGVKLTGSAWNNSGTASGASPAGDYPLSFGHGIGYYGWSYLESPPNCSFQHPAVFPAWLSDSDIDDLAALFTAKDVSDFEAGLTAKGASGAWRIGDTDIETIVALSTPTFNANAAYGEVPTANHRLQEPGHLMIPMATEGGGDPPASSSPASMIMSRGF